MIQQNSRDALIITYFTEHTGLTLKDSENGCTYEEGRKNPKGR